MAHSELRILAEKFDKALIDKELQLIPDKEEPCWSRALPPSRMNKSISQQIEYWCGLFRCKKEGKNKLFKMGYAIQIVIFISISEEVELSGSIINLLSAYNIGLILKVV
ncbi:MAG: hypothetical protein D6B27_12310 [Gammaproteobacteria bacterium]|nr:MAG: hypothetical protein D6B27_12310 [Gammaproteobacteria bacterium]